MTVASPPAVATTEGLAGLMSMARMPPCKSAWGGGKQSPRVSPWVQRLLHRDVQGCLAAQPAAKRMRAPCLSCAEGGWTAARRRPGPPALPLQGMGSGPQLVSNHSQRPMKLYSPRARPQSSGLDASELTCGADGALLAPLAELVGGGGEGLRNVGRDASLGLRYPERRAVSACAPHSTMHATRRSKLPERPS